MGRRFTEQIATNHLIISAIIGTLVTLVMFASVWYYRIVSLKRGKLLRMRKAG